MSKELNDTDRLLKKDGIRRVQRRLAQTWCYEQDEARQVERRITQLCCLE